MLLSTFELFITVCLSTSLFSSVFSMVSPTKDEESLKLFCDFLFKNKTQNLIIPCYSYATGEIPMFESNTGFGCRNYS